MEIIVGSKIIIKQPTQEIVEWCKKNLILDNPDYYKKEAMGKYTGNTPSRIWLYENMGDEIWLPFGCLTTLYRMCKRDTPFKAQFSPLRAFDYQSHISLYPYQEKAVNEAVRLQNGILVMPCGSGKTRCGLEIISRIGGRALWLTHTQDLLNQSKKRAESVLGYVGEGTITAGKVNVGQGITFATVQTLAKSVDVLNYKNEWDVIIVDECQHCAGSPTRVSQFYKVMSRLSARYKFGLTATPKRADGLERSMFALLGGIVHKVKREEVAHTTCPVKVYRVNTGWEPDYDYILMGDGTIDYNKVIVDMTYDEKRYKYIMAHIQAFKGPCMVLANRVEYLQRMNDEYNEKLGRSVCLSGMGQSVKAKAERKAALEALNNGELDYVFATYQLAKEGLDVPNLRYVILATPERDETTVIQSVGRVGRKAEGKDCGIVVDFVDSFGMYQGWWKKRAGYYKKIGAEVKGGDVG